MFMFQEPAWHVKLKMTWSNHFKYKASLQNFQAKSAVTFQAGICKIPLAPTDFSVYADKPFQ